MFKLISQLNKFPLIISGDGVAPIYKSCGGNMSLTSMFDRKAQPVFVTVILNCISSPTFASIFSFQSPQGSFLTFFSSFKSLLQVEIITLHASIPLIDEGLLHPPA